MILRIRYRSGNQVTERMVSDLIIDPPNAIHAFCHLRNERRTFILSSIERAFNLSTDTEIGDIWTHLGLPSLKPKEPQMPTFSGIPEPLTTKEAQRRRTADKAALFRRFELPVIADAYRRKLWALFDNRCFRCGSSTALHLDHHIPQYLGGRLIPGNVVILCACCNAAKLDRHPSDFYSAEQLQTVEPLLAAELTLFDFRFDWAAWHREPKAYLVSLGIPDNVAVLFR